MNKLKLILTIGCLLLATMVQAQVWQLMGGQMDGRESNCVSITTSPLDTPFVAYGRWVRTGVNSTGFQARVKKFNGTNWENLGDVGGTAVKEVICRTGKNGTPYICTYASLTNFNTIAVYRYDSIGSWTRNGWVFGNANGLFASRVSFALDTNNIPYVAYVENSSSSKVVVKKFNTSSNNYVQLGTHLAINSNGYTSIAIDSSNVPYIGYRAGSSSSQKANVKKFDSTSSSWVSVGNSGFSAGGFAYIKLAFDSKNVLYAAYQDVTKGNKATVMKYTGTGSWQAVGDTGFTNARADAISLSIDGNDIPYVSCVDDNHPITRKFNGTNWVTVGDTNYATPRDNRVSFSATVDSKGNGFAFYRGTASTDRDSVRFYRERTEWVGPQNSAYWNNWLPDSLTDVVIKSTGAPPSFTCKDFTLDATFFNLPDTNTYTVHGDVSSINSFTYSQFYGDATFVLTKEGTATLSGKDIVPEGKLIVESGCTLFIDSNTTLTIDSTLELKGNLSMHDNATLNISGGKLLLSGTTAQTLNLGHTGHKIVTVEDMELDNSAGASFGYGIIDVRRDYIPTAGTLNSNNRLRLVSNATYTGRIAQGSSSGGYITGNIVARLYIPGGRRAFRFLAHSAPDTKPLSGITDNIDITGSGGSTNGFTTTQSNYPSAFYFDVTTADNSTAGNNPGWQAFTAANVNNWYKGQVMRILIRGKAGEGLNGGSYTPSAATLGMNQQVNQGDQTMTLTKGTNTNFVLVGNPFPSQVQLNTVARGSNVGANFYIWNPNQGVKGAYTSHQFSTSYILPQWGAFVTTVSGNTNNTMVFEEADKTDGTPATQFKTTGSKYLLELSIEDTAYSWDKLLLNFDDDGYAVQDQLDAVKLNNPGLDFYTISQDGTDLSIDVRPIENEVVVPVGLDVWHYGGSGRFTIMTEELNLPTGATLMFHDKYLNKQVPITDTFSYTFIVDKADSRSGGKNRFEIGVTNMPTSIAALSNDEVAQIQVYPNPTNGQLHIAYKNLEGASTISIYDMTGRVVYKTSNKSIDGNGLIEINAEVLVQGTYIVELKNKTRTITKKIIRG